jgi:LPXTG-motif cell wall-anchored protein
MTQNVPETPTRPVDEKGNPIEVPADKTMPIVDGFPGDEVEIDIKDIPDIPGYDKPVADENGKVKVKVPEAGKMIDLPYTEKSTPTRPVDEKGNPIEVPAGETMPDVKGEPGDEVELNVDDLPNIPGYEKPKSENGKVKVKIVDDGKGGKVYDVTYTEKTTPTRPVDGKGNPIEVPAGKTMPDVKGEPGDEALLDVNDLPDIPGYAKPEADENGKVKVKIVDDGKGGKIYDVPYSEKSTPSRPVDEKGNPIEVPAGKTMPEVKGEPGDEAELDVNDLPDIPGYEKPKGDKDGKVKVKIVDDGKGGKVYDVTYAEKTTPTRPVDEKGNPIDVPKDTKMPDVKGEPGEEVELDVNDLPDIPGYAKPEADENGKVKVKIKDDGKGGKVYDVPYTQATPTRPVDEKGNPIDVPKDAKMPEVKGEPGEEVELDVNDLPDIPGYDKPKGDKNGKIKVQIPEYGKPADVPYTPAEDKKTPSRPVDEKTGEEIKLPEGKTMPELDGKPGEEVEIDVNDLPDIPGYDKPKGDKNGKIKVQIPEDGKSVDVPYTPKKNTTPSRPVDKNTGKEIKTDKSFPILEGKPGDVVEIDVNDLPDIPGYDKPKGDKNGKIKVTIPENGMIDFGYTPIEAGKPGQSQQNNNGSKNTPDNNAPQKGKSKGGAAYPNTGSETNALVSALGAAMLALTGLFAGLTKLRKK